MSKLKQAICSYCSKTLHRHDKNKRIKVEVRSNNAHGATVIVHAGECPKEKK